MPFGDASAVGVAGITLGIVELLQKHGCQIESTMIELRGFEEQVKIYKVTGAN